MAKKQEGEYSGDELSEIDVTEDMVIESEDGEPIAAEKGKDPLEQIDASEYESEEEGEEPERSSDTSARSEEETEERGEAKMPAHAPAPARHSRKSAAKRGRSKPKAEESKAEGKKRASREGNAGDSEEEERRSATVEHIRKEKREDSEEDSPLPAASSRHAKPKGLRMRYGNVALVLGILLLGVMAYNFYQGFGIQQLIQEKAGQHAEAARPPRIELTLLSTNCTQCFDTGQVLLFLEGFSVNLTKQRSVAANSPEGKALLARYNITQVPNLLVQGELEKASSLVSSWQEFGAKREDALVLTQVPPPYVDVATGSIHGVVDVTYLTDASCSRCYNVTVHRNILQDGYRVAFGSENYVDVSGPEGEALASRYGITLVPTVVISPELSAYLALSPVWAIVGTIESDGSYVFRNFAAFPGNTYRNLTSGDIINNTGAQAALAP